VNRKGIFGAACFGLSAGLLSTYVVAQSEFGAPPAGRVPILYNDHHVYARPDELRSGRVLAALVQGETILIPLRSMFEAMGARVDYDPDSHAVVVSRGDRVISVTAGRPTVVIDGESRPLDVPPEVVGGRLLVPVRVLAEGLGAYVQWQPSLHVVTIRYRPNAAPSSPVVYATAPPAAPTATPLPPRPVIPPGPPPPRPPREDETFVVGDALVATNVSNAFAHGTGRSDSYAGRGVGEFTLLNIPWMLAVEGASYGFHHPAGPVTVLGGGGATVIPGLDGREDEFAAKLGVGVAPTRIYAGIGLFRASDSLGTPVTTGLGAGLTKQPDLDQATSLYGDVWYYPNVQGVCPTATCPAGGTLAHSALTFRGGGTLRLGSEQSRLFLDAGYQGERRKAKSLAPVDTTLSAGYIGLGIRF